MENSDLSFISTMWFSLFKNGMVAAELNRLEEAYELFRSALKVTDQFAANDPRKVLTLSKLAEVAEKLERLDEAIQIVRSMLSLKFQMVGLTARTFITDLRRLVYLQARKGDWRSARATQMIADGLARNHSFADTEEQDSVTVQSKEQQTTTQDVPPVSISDIQLMKNLGLPLFSQQQRRHRLDSTANLNVCKSSLPKAASS